MSIFASVLTEENSKELLKQVRGQSKAQVEQVVGQYREPQQVLKDKVRPVRACSAKPAVVEESQEQGLFSSSKSLSKCHSDSENQREQGKIEETKYKIEFPAGEEFMGLLRKVQALVSGKFPGGGSFEQVLGEVMEEYLERHSPERRAARRAEREQKKQSVKSENKSPEKSTDKPSRHIPAAVRDEVFCRDGGQCTFVGPDGRRCQARDQLELDHILPYSLGGGHEVDNLRLRCKQHNLLEAEKHFGREFMEGFRREGQRVAVTV